MTHDSWYQNIKIPSRARPSTLTGPLFPLCRDPPKSTILASKYLDAENVFFVTAPTRKHCFCSPRHPQKSIKNRSQIHQNRHLDPQGSSGLSLWTPAWPKSCPRVSQWSHLGSTGGLRAAPVHPTMAKIVPQDSFSTCRGHHKVTI